MNRRHGPHQCAEKYNSTFGMSLRTSESTGLPAAFIKFGPISLTRFSWAGPCGAEVGGVAAAASAANASRAHGVNDKASLESGVDEADFNANSTVPAGDRSRIA